MNCFRCAADWLMLRQAGSAFLVCPACGGCPFPDGLTAAELPALYPELIAAGWSPPHITIRLGWVTARRAELERLAEREAEQVKQQAEWRANLLADERRVRLRHRAIGKRIKIAQGSLDLRTMIRRDDVPAYEAVRGNNGYGTALVHGFALLKASY